MKSELLWDAMGHIDESRIEEALRQPEDRPAGKKRKKSRLKKGSRPQPRLRLSSWWGLPCWPRKVRLFTRPFIRFLLLRHSSLFRSGRHVLIMGYGWKWNPPAWKEILPGFMFPFRIWKETESMKRRIFLTAMPSDAALTVLVPAAESPMMKKTEKPLSL